MSASNVDLIFVVDASASMQPCFEALARHLDEVVRPLQGFNFNVRFGLVTLRVGRNAAGGQIIDVRTLSGGMESVYPTPSSDLFTRDGNELARQLQNTELAGDENNLIALDFALDFPFGPVSTTRRVIALFSDETLEDGADSPTMLATLPKMIEKITARRVLLFAAMPPSNALDELATCDGAHVVGVRSGDGLSSVDFSKLMGQMAKSISAGSAQGNEAPWEKGLFGQLHWGQSSGSFNGLR